MKKTSYTLLILSAILALALNLLLSLTGNFLTARLEPYQTWIYWGLAIVFLVSLALLIIEARRAPNPGGTTITQRATKGGKIRRSPITATTSGNLQVEQSAHDQAEIVDSAIKAKPTTDATIQQQASGQGSKIDKSGLSI